MSDITNLATNNTRNVKINKVKNEIPSIINLAATTVPNAKINEIKNKIPNTTNSTTTTALAAVDKKLNVSNLVKKKLDYSTKISEIENKITNHDHSNKYITTQKFSNLTSENGAARLTHATLSTLSLHLQISRMLRARSSLTFRQL